MAFPDLTATPPGDTARFDLILRGGEVLDGTGAPSFRADVGIRDGRIAAIGSIPADARSTDSLDATGAMVAPGFIDIHTHSDISVLYTPGMDSSLAQGVTSEVVGNCGFSLGLARPDEAFALEARGLERSGLKIEWSTLPGFLQRVEDSGTAINLATLAGHGTLRKRTMGMAERLPDAGELAAMQRDLADALEAGAIGLSSGLEYVPGMYADVAELTALASVTRDAGGFYATHLRDEGDFLLEAVGEAIAVAEGAGLPLQLSHHKSERPRNWGKISQSLALVDAAQARGLDVLLDQYPYTAYQTGLGTIALPPWAASGTPALLAERLRDGENRQKVRAQMLEADWRAVVIAYCPAHRDYEGYAITDLAAERKQDPRDWILDLFAEGDGFTAAVHHALSEADVEQVMRDPRVMIGSDGVASCPTGANMIDRIHPRTYGTFPRVLGRYVREQQVLSLPEAVRRMTSLPAQRLGWRDRGILATGGAGDITVFDPHTVTDAATFEAPHAFAVGIRYVLVNGTLAWENGVTTGARSGRVLRRGA